MFLSRRLTRFIVLSLLVGSSAPAASTPATPVNIVLITVDTTRADRMGFLGSQLGLTPNLDALARHGVAFSRAYAQVPLTTPSHAVLLTGTYPQFNHLGDLGNPLAADLPYLPALLRSKGYRTAAFVGSQVLDPKSAAAPGFNRGFDFYDAGFRSRRSGEDRYGSEERRASVVIARALAWLKRQPRSAPFFVWIHLYDAHDPYDPPEPFKTKYSTVPYDGEIAYVDAALGKFFAVLKADGLCDSTSIAVVADHGEAFGEHGEESHGFFLYDETMHVPLLLKLPQNRAAGRSIDSPVALVDVAPTLLEVAGVKPPSAMQGRSLLRMVKEPGQAGKASPQGLAVAESIYSETDYPHRSFGWSSLRSLRSGKYLYVDAPHRELYDIVSDPKAMRNLAESSPGVADTMQAQLDAFRTETTAAMRAPAAKLTPEQAEKLQALGYLTSASNAAMGETKTGADPKDKIQTANRLHHAVLATEEERYQDAVALLQQVVKDEPAIALANLELGRALNGLGRFGEAIPWLGKAVELTPDSGRAHYELGVALGETGDWSGSAEQLEAAVARAPDSDDLHFYLAMADDQIGRTAEAEKNFREALRINPAHYRATLFLGRLLGMHDRPAEAVTYLQSAAKLDPKSPDPHKFLANVYTLLGRMPDATREREEAQRLGSGQP